MKISLTLAEQRLIRFLLWDNKTKGDYYGNREQYKIRRDKLIKKLERIKDANIPTVS